MITRLDKLFPVFCAVLIGLEACAALLFAAFGDWLRSGFLIMQIGFLLAVLWSHESPTIVIIEQRPAERPRRVA